MDASNPDNCPFCTMPSSRVIESAGHAFTVADLFPVSRGHTLVISRRHVANVFDLAEPEVGDLVRLVQSAKNRLDQEYQPSGYNIGVNVGRAAGQTVFHVHVHLIPRYEGDIANPSGGVRNIVRQRRDS